MANLYVRSTDGNNADNGSTWALAKATLAGAAAIDAAGDRIYVSQAHSESSASAQTISLAGTATSPVWVIGGDDAAEPPTAVSTAPIVATTGASSITINGHCYVYGITFSAGSTATAASILTAQSSADTQTYERCAFKLGASAASSVIQLGQAASSWVSDVRLKNCDVSFSGSGQTIYLGAGRVEWHGGTALASTSTPTSAGMFTLTTRNGVALIEGLDLTNFSSSLNLASATGSGRLIIRNCKLPASWAGSLYTGTKVAGARIEMHNCDSADTNYWLQVDDFCGSIVTETTIVKSGGASDGTTPISWKMVSNSTAEYPQLTIDSPEIVRWNSTTGSSITVTVETVTDNVTLTDAECWIEVQYLGTSGRPLSTFINDAKADVLATADNQTSSSVTWTTTGLTTPVKQSLSVSFTPQEAGYIHAVVKLAKASTTVYVDPLLTVT